MDLATFWDCHRRAFAHFGGVPGSDRLRPHQDRDQTPRRTAGGGAAAPGGGGVRRPLRVRHRRAGRLPADREGPGRAAGRDRPRPRARRPAASTRSPSWTARSPPGCRSAAAQVHRTHGQVIAVRAEAGPGRAAAAARRSRIWSTEKHLRRVGRDCLISLRGVVLLGAGPPGPARAAGPAECSPRPGRTATGSSSPPRPSTAAAGWPPIPARPAAAPGSSTRPTGPGCPTATPAPPSSNQPLRPAGAEPGQPQPGHWSRCRRC